MRPTHLIAAGLIAAGLPAMLRRVQTRQRWEHANRQVYLALDFEQASVAATRTGWSLYDYLHECRHHGATHVAMREDTLHDLLQRGEIALLTGGEPEHHHFACKRPEVCARLRDEFAARWPHLLLELPDPAVLALRGDLNALRPLGLGFDPERLRFARSTGLQLIARPVTYPWPNAAAIERTLAQAAALGATLIAFADDPVLGHEMLMDITAASLERHRLRFAYFADSRHQRGDWFLAKRGGERTVLALRFTPAELDRSDEHGLAYRAALRVREGGIRLIFVDTHIGVHATTPTAVFRYLDALVHEIGGHGGFEIDLPEHHHHGADNADNSAEHHHHHEHAHQHGPAAGLLPPPDALLAPTERALSALAERTRSLPDFPVSLPLTGLGLLALDRICPLPWPIAGALAGMGAFAGAKLLPMLDRPRSDLEQTFAPSYVAKLTALAALTLGPASGVSGLMAAPLAGLLASAASAEPAYQQRVELIRTLNLDWAVPLALQLASEPPTLLAGARRWPAAAAVLALPLVLRSRLPADLVAALNNEHVEGHTHHLSAAQRVIGDVRLALSPGPLRKWAGLSWLWGVYAFLPAGSDARAWAGLAATAGSIAVAGTLRNPSRPFALSAAQAAHSYLLATPLLALTLWGARASS